MPTFGVFNVFNGITLQLLNPNKSCTSRDQINCIQLIFFLKTFSPDSYQISTFTLHENFLYFLAPAQRDSAG